MFRPPADVVPLAQQRPQPARGDPHSGGLGQVGAEPRRGPHVEGQPQGTWRPPQRRFGRLAIGGIGRDGPPTPRGIRQSSHPARRIAPEPAAQRPLRAPAPPRDRRQVLPQRDRFHHLQPFPEPRRQIAPPQPPVHFSSLGGTHHQPRFALLRHPFGFLIREPPRALFSSSLPLGTRTYQPILRYGF